MWLYRVSKNTVYKNNYRFNEILRFKNFSEMDLISCPFQKGWKEWKRKKKAQLV